MNLVAVFAFFAVLASQSEAWIQTTEVCTAYFKATGVVSDLTSIPVGQMWEDKVCVQDPSFYLYCKLFNGVISGDLQQCPPGKLFDQYAMKPWDKTCVPASTCQQKKCPNWIQSIYEEFNRGRQTYHSQFSRVHRLRHRRMSSVLVPRRAEMVL